MLLLYIPGMSITSKRAEAGCAAFIHLGWQWQAFLDLFCNPVGLDLDLVPQLVKLMPVI